MRFLRDYGAFIAATIAALVAIGNGWLSTRRERRSTHENWLRQLRLPSYAALLKAADDYGTSLFMEFGNWNPQDYGPVPPRSIPVGEAQQAFDHAMLDVALVGPAEVGRRANEVRFSLRHYANELQADPDAFSPRFAIRTRERFIEACTNALGVPYTAEPGYKGFKEWLAVEEELDEVHD